MRALALLLVAGTALAETPVRRATAVDVDRDSTPVGRPELGFDGGAPLDGGWAISAQLGWLERPLSLTSSDGVSYPVARRQTLFLGGALALGERGIFEARLPIAHQTGDRLTRAGAASEPGALDAWVVGDLHLATRIRVVAQPTLSVFARIDLGLPTGNQYQFAGDSSWNLGWSLISRFALPAGIHLAASGGIRLRGDEVFIADRIVSNELFGAAGISVPLPPIAPLWCAREQVMLSAEVAGVLGDRVAGARGPSPVEARLGLVTRPRANVTLGVRVGAGLTDAEIGAPRWRALVELTLWGSGQVASLLPTLERAPAEDDDAAEP